MKKSSVVLFLLAVLLISQRGYSQLRKTENLVIVTLDGMRWQEVFGGMDSALVVNKKYTRDSASIVKAFGGATREIRREKLFPFLFDTIMAKGQLYGDRLNGSEVDNANRYKFSYPGYNEIFTGYPDTLVNSNDLIKNKNVTVLEKINQQAEYKGKVAVFGTWEAYPFIFNKWRSGIYVNSNVDTLKFADPSLKMLNEMQFLELSPTGERLDLLTYFMGREYLKTHKPRVLYIAFDETDDFAHGGEYDLVLKAAHAEDAMIADLWKTLQSMPQYAGKTTLLICSDHGRGDKIKEQWTDHGEKVEDAGHIWIAAMGPDTRPMGLVKTDTPVYQKQLAATMGALLGMRFSPVSGKADPIATILKP